MHAKQLDAPPLPEHPETATLDQLMKTDFQVEAEARPSVAMQAFAVIGVNTALIQAAVMAKSKIHTVVPGKVAVRADFARRSFKVEVLPAAAPDHIAAASFETVAVARNIEDLPADRVASLAPAVPSGVQPLIPASIQKTLCGTVPYFHVKACLEIASHNVGFMVYNPLYFIVGQHEARLSVGRGDGPALERLEFEAHVGPKAAEKLVKETSLAETETQEENIILLKLREYLEAGLMSMNSSSSRSSSSISSSASSSLSSSSSRMSKKFHMDQAKLLGDAIPPVVAIIARAVRSDCKLGYQFAAYLDKPTSRAQLVFSSAAADEKWKLCADGVLPSKHKASARVSWGAECQEASATVKAETGLHESNPAARFEVEWDRIPRLVTLVAIYAKRATEYLPVHQSARLAGINVGRAENKQNKIALIVALSTKKSLNVIMRAPKMTVSKLAVPLPTAVPIEKDGSIPRLQNLDIEGIIQKLDIRGRIANLDIRGALRNVDIDEVLEKVQHQIEKLQNLTEKYQNDYLTKLDIRTIIQEYDLRATLEKIQNSDFRTIIEKLINDVQAQIPAHVM